MTDTGVIVLGGNDNALSIGRALGRRGITVRLLEHRPGSAAASRYLESLELPGSGSFIDDAFGFLTGPDAAHLRGDLLIAASDDAIELLIAHHEQLREHYLLDRFNPDAAATLLDKLATYEAAARCGVPTPRFWQLRTPADLEQHRDDLVFPLIVKPRHTHVFERRFGRKFLAAEDGSELDEAIEVAAAADVDVLLLERIPGRDADLCSYYTYLDDDGSPRFDFTKRIIRRNPPGMGLASAHVTDHVEGIRGPALALFAEVGLLGVANVEFILDRRDGQYKLIESNARFTASNALVHRAGIDIASVVYNNAVGLPPPELPDQTNGLTMVDPIRDVGAFRSHRDAGLIDTPTWLKSVARRHAVVGQFALDDPMPEVARLTTKLGSAVTSVARRS